MANRNSIRSSFRSVFTSGNRGLIQMLNVLDHVQQHGDTSLVAVILDDAEKYATDGARTYQSAIKLIFKAVFTEASVRKNKEGKHSVKRGTEVDQVAFGKVRDLADAGYSLIGSSVKEAFGDNTVTEEKKAANDARQLKMALGQVAKAIHDQRITRDEVDAELTAMVQALAAKVAA